MDNKDLAIVTKQRFLLSVSISQNKLIYTFVYIRIMEIKKCRLKTLSLRPINIVGHIAPPHNRKKKISTSPQRGNRDIFYFGLFFSVLLNMQVIFRTDIAQTGERSKPTFLFIKFAFIILDVIQEATGNRYKIYVCVLFISNS